MTAPYRTASDREEYTAAELLEQVRAELSSVTAENARLLARMEVVDDTNVDLARRLTRCVVALEAVAASDVSDAVKQIALAALIY